MNRTLDAFAQSYLEALLWSTTDDNGEPLGRDYAFSDLTPDALTKCLAECADFRAAHADLLAHAGDDSQNGHDFALTRNGHGAGFWDRGYGEVGRKLTDACRPYGEAHLYAGDDGRLHL